MADTETHDVEIVKQFSLFLNPDTGDGYREKVSGFLESRYTIGRSKR